MAEMPVDINYLAVLISAVVAFALGALWYSPVLFAKPWMAALGKTADQFQEEQKGQNMPLTYGLTFVAWLLTAFVLAHFVDYAGATTLAAGLQTGWWVWLGFSLTYALIHGLFEGQAFMLYVIHLGYHLVALLGMGAMQAVWT